MAMLNSDVLRNSWWKLSLNAHTIFRVLYETQDEVPSEELARQLYADDLYKVFGWIGRSFKGKGSGGYSHFTFFDWGADGYRLRDHWRPVVGELLGHHEKEKTILLETLWSMTRMFGLLERRVGDTPGERPADFSMEFKTRQQELEGLLQELGSLLQDDVDCVCVEED